MNYALTTRKAALAAAQAAMKGIPRRASRSSIYSSPEAKRRTGVMVSVCKAGLSIGGQLVPAEVPVSLHGYQVTLDGHLLYDLLKRMAGLLVSLSQVEGDLCLECAGFTVTLVGWDVRLPDAPAVQAVPEVPAALPAPAKAATPKTRRAAPAPAPAPAKAAKPKTRKRRYSNDATAGDGAFYLKTRL